MGFVGKEDGVGYYQLIGVTAMNEVDITGQLRRFIENDGGVLVAVNDVYSPDFDGRDRDIRDECGDLANVGIWYVSGRAFFSLAGSEDD